ncbi:hypothetical protein [Latilactobacillus fragifolii]|uniref:hypothetical protein n=1 Tax=Latilactobacillus fragifolii TaxID=2814244 RepID=UPI001ABA5B8D|nr:hypothetical protein [Latilactobacillus fragifolii]
MKKIILFLFLLGLIIIGGPIIGSATTENALDGNDLAQQWDRFIDSWAAIPKSELPIKLQSIL